MNKINYTFVIIFVYILINGCCSCLLYKNTHKTFYSLSEEYSDTTGNISIRIWEKDGIIYGSHCFVFQNGNRIDYNDSISIELRLVNDKECKGIFCSEYDNNKYSISIIKHNYFIYFYTSVRLNFSER